MVRAGASLAVPLALACGPDAAPEAPFERAAYVHLVGTTPWITDLDGARHALGDARAAVIDWSRDGRLAWLTRDPAGSFDIDVWVADAGSMRMAASFVPAQTQPDSLLALRWSPDGDAIAGHFGGPSVLSHDGDVQELFVVEFDAPDAGRELGNPGANGFAPVWSPRGDAVVGVGWVYDQDPSHGGSGLFVHDLTTDEIRIPTIGRIHGTQPPAWSSDGQRFAFATPVADTLDIHVATSLDASTPLLTGPCDDFDPRWIGEGRTLLVRHVCADAPATDLAVDADDGQILSTIDGLGVWAQLSSDGTRALWTEGPDVVVYDLTRRQVLERTAGRSPRWRPRGD